MHAGVGVLVAGHPDRVARCIGMVSKTRGWIVASDGVAKLRAPAEFGAPCDLLPRVRFEPASFGGVGNIRLGSGCRPSLPVGTISETVSVMLIRCPSDGSRVQRGQANSTGEPLV